MMSIRYKRVVKIIKIRKIFRFKKVVIAGNQ